MIIEIINSSFRVYNAVFVYNMLYHLKTCDFGETRWDDPPDDLVASGRGEGAGVEEVLVEVHVEMRG